jgi:hypothetical protein
MTSQLEDRATSIWAHLFRYRVDELRRAYEAAREASDRDRVRLQREWEGLERDVAAGRAALTEEDEEGRVIYDRGEHAGEMMAETEGILRIVREAFVRSLHHLWERELTAKMRIARYDESKAVAFLKSEGIDPNQTKLTVLRLAANVAKHSEGNSAEQLYKLRPELFDGVEMARWKDPPAHEYLRITDQTVDEFFGAIRSSGPQRKPWTANAQSAVPTS